ncbi:MAG: transporter substrate-binding domain-containing protein [Lachnospiraceae bacterium]|nr:transporter substrate-binding domain-containing protein [Lachnospiraceae bacterium]
MKMKQFAALVVSAACALSLAACGGSSGSASAESAPAESAASEAASAAEGAGEAASDSAVAAIQAAGKVVMTTNAEFEPFEYKEGDAFAGIDIDIANAIAEELGVELEITDIAFDSLIPSLNAGKADFIAAGMTATEDRRKNVDFSDSYFNASQSIIVMKDSEITGRSDLNDKVVGVQQGTTGDVYCTNEDGSSDVKVKEVRRYPKGMDAVSDLLAGRLDAVVIDDFPATKLVEKNADKIQKLDEALTEEEYAIALPKGSDLTEVVNKVIADLNESGKMDEIVSTYISAE